jgi:tetratricopeptide (TPR) repeat protein
VRRLGGGARPGIASLTPLLLSLLLVACGSPGPPSGSSEPGEIAEVAVPEPDMTDMEPEVAQRLREARREVVAHPDSAEAWGRFGRVAHAHELWDEAQIAYRRAWDLDPSDERWPYFLGDVLSVVGTDLEAATEAFERTLDLRPGYAPAHMRLGRVLVARGLPERAAEQFERALELAPDLQPARVGLAQIRLSQGELARAEELLDEVLAEEPRHAQALSTLGQVYMRQGRRKEAREVAERARDAALYNLFADPLMEQVVREEASSVLLWERAKAFFDNGDYEQAVRGLEQVVQRRPTNPDVHHQLAIAYGNLGRFDLSRRHLERVIALDGDRVEPRIQLALLHLEQGRPAAAIPLLRRVLELAPEDRDAGWLLGRAQVQTDDPEGALATFEAAAEVAEDAGRPVPSWAHNEWGNALARTGRPQQALDHFRAALRADPDNAQALFYAGLVHEGLGGIDEAVELYCRSMAAEPNPPAAGRLQTLGRSCTGP